MSVPARTRERSPDPRLVAVAGAGRAARPVFPDHADGAPAPPQAGAEAASTRRGGFRESHAGVRCHADDLALPVAGAPILLSSSARADAR